MDQQSRPPGWYAGLAHRSRGPMARVARLPRWILVVGVAALLFGGLAGRGPFAALALVVLSGFLGWLAALSWPVASPWTRVLRIAVAAGLFVAAGLRVGR